MSHLSSHVNSTKRPSDRRVARRQPVRSLAYVELGEGNGGIVLNVSEGGLAVQAVMSLMTDELPCMRLQLAHSQKQIEAKGRIAWTSEFRKLAGVEFVDLSPDALSQIREWISIEAPGTRVAEKPAARKLEITEPAAAVPSRAETTKAAPEPPKIAVAPEVKRLNTPPLQRPASESAASPVNAGVNAAVPAPVAAAVPAPTPVPDPALVAIAFAVPAVPAVANTATANAAAPVALSLPSVSPPVDRYGFKPGVPPPSLQPPEPPKTQSRKKTALLVGSFAIVSLAVGWIAGRVGLRHALTSSDDTQPVETVGETAAASPNISQIEVVDVNNQRWTIPFDSGGTPSTKNTLPGQARESATSIPTQSGEPKPTSAVAGAFGGKTSSPSNGEEQNGRTSIASSANPRNTSRAALADSTAPASAPSSAGRTPAATDGALQPGGLVRRVEPDYPADALAQGIEGVVKLYAVIDQDGAVKTVQPLSGPSILYPAAISAVSQWRYSQTFLSGRPIETERQITITFSLSPARSN